MYVARRKKTETKQKRWKNEKNDEVEMKEYTRGEKCCISLPACIAIEIEYPFLLDCILYV